MKISADFDMWVRIARYFPVGFINKKLICLRDHRGQLSRNETFYINHVKEDMRVFAYLDSYVTPELKQSGHKILRKHKLVFYYTLMMKALLKGKLRSAGAFYKELRHRDDFLLLSIQFLRSKILGK
jgi:hypothetical protein